MSYIQVAKSCRYRRQNMQRRIGDVWPTGQ